MSPARKAESCALCGAPQSPEHKPFCSQGCRDRDLINWLSEGYLVPGRAEEPNGLDSEAEPNL